jgi:hypothetical protein
MSVALTREELYSTGDDVNPNIFDSLSGFFEDLSGGDGINSVQNLYNMGVEQSPEIEYLWDLMVKLDEFQTSEEYTFTDEEIDELYKKIATIRTLNMPTYLKDALSKVESLIKAHKRRMSAKVTAKELEGLGNLVNSNKIKKNSASVVASFLTGNTGTLKGQRNKQKQKFGIPLAPRARKNRKTRKARRNRRTVKY